MNFAPPAVELKARLVLRGSCAFLALLMVNICLYFVRLMDRSSYCIKFYSLSFSTPKSTAGTAIYVKLTLGGTLFYGSDTVGSFVIRARC